jgi:hypothetical protein
VGSGTELGDVDGDGVGSYGADGVGFAVVVGDGTPVDVQPFLSLFRTFPVGH